MTDQEKAFIESCVKGDLKSVKECIKYGVDIHVEDDWALGVASTNGHSKLIIHLLESGVSDDAGVRHRTLAYSVHNRDLALTHFLMTRSEKYNADNSAIIWASASGNNEAVEMLLPYISDLSWVYCNAAKYGHVHTIQLLNDNSIFEHDRNMNLVLNWAMEKNQLQVVHLLVEEGIVSMDTMGKRSREKYDLSMESYNK